MLYWKLQFVIERFQWNQLYFVFFYKSCSREFFFDSRNCVKLVTALTSIVFVCAELEFKMYLVNPPSQIILVFFFFFNAVSKPKQPCVDVSI